MYIHCRIILYGYRKMLILFVLVASFAFFIIVSIFSVVCGMGYAKKMFDADREKYVRTIDHLTTQIANAQRAMSPDQLAKYRLKILKCVEKDNVVEIGSGSKEKGVEEDIHHE